MAHFFSNRIRHNKYYSDVLLGITTSTYSKLLLHTFDSLAHLTNCALLFITVNGYSYVSSYYNSRSIAAACCASIGMFLRSICYKEWLLVVVTATARCFLMFRQPWQNEKSIHTLFFCLDSCIVLQAECGWCSKKKESQNRDREKSHFHYIFHVLASPLTGAMALHPSEWISSHECKMSCNFVANYPNTNDAFPTFDSQI